MLIRINNGHCLKTVSSKLQEVSTGGAEIYFDKGGMVNSFYFLPCRHEQAYTCFQTAKSCHLHRKHTT